MKTSGQKLYEVWRTFALQASPQSEPGDWDEDLYAHEKTAWQRLADAVKPEEARG
jgi:hypothetical protein